MGICKCLLMLAHLLTQVTQALRNSWMSLMVKGISHLGLFWEIIRSGLYHLIIHLTSILYHQYAYSPYCSL